MARAACYYTSVKEKSLREAEMLRKISLSAVALVTVSMEMNVALLMVYCHVDQNAVDKLAPRDPSDTFRCPLSEYVEFLKK